MVVEGCVSEFEHISFRLVKHFTADPCSPLLQLLTTTFYLSLTKRLGLPKHDREDINRALTVRSSY